MKIFYRLTLLSKLLLTGMGLSQAQNLILTTPASQTPGSANVIVNPTWVYSSQSQNSINNTIVGHDAGINLTTGLSNTFIGKSAGFANTSGDQNTFIGTDAGRNNTTGGQNTFVGFNAGQSSTNAGSNTFLGYFAGFKTTNAINNTIVGAGAGKENTTGGGNLFVGTQAGIYNTTGTDNVYLGYGAGGGNSGGSENVMIGKLAGQLNAVSNNTFVGTQAGYRSQSGARNTYFGYQSGYNAVADSNTFVGYQAGYTTTTGKGNTFFGTSSGRSNTTGSHNTFVGNGAGPASSTMDDNVYIGFTTGNHDSGSKNTFLGTGADAIAENLINATAIGAGARVAVSNAVVLGNQANVGIGTSAPTARLDVNSGIEHESGIRMSRLTASSPVQLASTNKVLTVDAGGRVVLTQTGHYSVGQVNDWSDKVFASSYTLRSLIDVEQFIQKNGHLPGIPSAEQVVREGADVGKMDAKLLEKIEELTLYSIQLEKADRAKQQELQQLKAEVNELKQLVKQLVQKK